MKSLIPMMAAVLFTGSVFAAPQQQLAQKEKFVDFNDVYVQKDRGIVEPNELLVTGMYPNTCYTWVNAEVKHVDDFVHEVRGVAKVSQGACAMMQVPFTKEVDLGLLKEGVHTARVINGDGTTFEKTFTKTR